jgi:hypothetical protein
MICPAAVLNREFKTYLLSLYLQADEAPRICERLLHTVPPAPFLIRLGTEIVFYTPEPRRVFFRCKEQNRWQTSTRALKGSELIKGASSCHVSTDRVQLRPVLRAESWFNGPTQLLYTPSFQLLSSDGELQAVKKFINTSYFSAVAASPGVRLSLADDTARFGISATAGPHPKGTSWGVAALTSVVTTMCLLTAYRLIGYMWGQAHKPRDPQTSQPDDEVNTGRSPTVEPDETADPTTTARFCKRASYAPPSV